MIYDKREVAEWARAHAIRQGLEEFGPISA